MAGAAKRAWATDRGGGAGGRRAQEAQGVADGADTARRAGGGGAAGEHEPVASPMRRVGVRAAVVSPQTRERAAAHVRVARARREGERTAQRSMIYGDLEAARVGAQLPPVTTGRMAGRPVRGWVRDPDAEGRGPGDRGSTHLSELAPIPKRPRRC